MLGVRLIHSRPYSPQGRGKQERLNRFIRERFLLEAEAQGIPSFLELNDRFLAWAEQVCNLRQHAETGEVPLTRFLGRAIPRRWSRPCSGRPSGRPSPGGWTAPPPSPWRASATGWTPPW